MIKMMQISKVLVVMVLLVSCGINNPEEKLEGERSGTVFLEYNGMVSTRGGDVPSFTLMNDSTETIQYFGYSKIYPLFNAEAHTDTGWTHLMWGWCGTGAEYFNLDPDSSISFMGFSPNYSCTWRLVLDIVEIDSVNFRQIRSENIIYTILED